MKQLLTIFKFEYASVVKSKAYIITTLILLFGTIFLSNIPEGLAVAKNLGIGQKENKIKEIAIIDEEGIYTDEILSKYLENYNWTFFKKENLEEIKKEVDNEKYNLGVEIKENNYTLIIKGSNYMDQTGSSLEKMISETYKLNKFKEKGLLENEINNINNIEIKSERILVGKDLSQSMIIGYGLLIIMYMAVLMYGQMVSVSVINEKSSKVMEILITNARPINLLFGKVFGVGMAGLTQLGSILLVAFLVIKSKSGTWIEMFPQYSFILEFSLGFNIFLYAIIFFLLGFFTYAFLYAGLGSTANTIEDSNSVSLFPTLVFLLAFVVAMSSMENPTAEYIKLTSFVPLLSPLVMFMRICVSEVKFIEIFISIIINIVSIIFIGWVSSNIYKRGVMIYGKKLKIKEVIKMAKK